MKREEFLTRHGTASLSRKILLHGVVLFNKQSCNKVNNCNFISFIPCSCPASHVGSMFQQYRSMNKAPSLHESTRYPGQEVKLRTWIWEATVSNISRNTYYPGWSFSWLPGVSAIKCRGLYIDHKTITLRSLCRLNRRALITESVSYHQMLQKLLRIVLCSASLWLLWDTIESKEFSFMIVVWKQTHTNHEYFLSHPVQFIIH
jgi:hypothetical protein